MTDRSTRALRFVRRAIVFIVGATVTLFGVLLVVTPGPAIVVVPLGLMILATEFAWARVILVWVKNRIARLRSKPGAGAGPAPEAPAEPGQPEIVSAPEVPAESEIGSVPGSPPHER